MLKELFRSNFSWMSESGASRNVFLKCEIFVENDRDDADWKVYFIDSAVRFFVARINELSMKKAPENCRFLEIETMERIDNLEANANCKKDEQNVIYMLIKVGDYATFNAENTGPVCIVECPEKTVMEMPEDLEIGTSKEFSDEQKAALSLFSAYAIHELFHAFGMYHCPYGIMARECDLKDLTDADFDLESTFDHKSIVIFQEMMTLREPTDLTLTVTWIENRTRIKMETNKPMIMACFIEKTEYHDMFVRFDESQKARYVLMSCPSSWDTLIVLVANSGVFIVNRKDGEFVQKLRHFK